MAAGTTGAALLRSELVYARLPHVTQNARDRDLHGFGDEKAHRYHSYQAWAGMRASQLTNHHRPENATPPALRLGPGCSGLASGLERRGCGGSGSARFPSISRGADSPAGAASK